MSGDVLKEGFLTKSPPLDSKFASWKRRYFRLRESGHLDYYNNEKKGVGERKDSINLGNCSGVETLAQYEGKDFCIKVSTPDRVYIFKCVSSSEMQEWFEAIHRTYQSACGITQVTIADGPPLPEPGEASPMTTRPLPSVDESASFRPLPTLPPGGDASSLQHPAALSQEFRRPVASSASFDDGMKFQKRRKDTSKPRPSLPDVTAATDPGIYPSASSHSAKSPISPVAAEFPGDGRKPARKDGYTEVNFAAKKDPSSVQPTFAGKKNAGSAPKGRISYAHVEIGGRVVQPPSPSKNAAPQASRTNYTEVTIGNHNNPKPGQASRPAAPAANRTSYHQVDIQKTKAQRRLSGAESQLPPVPGKGDSYDDSYQRERCESTSYEAMEAAVPPPQDTALEEYEQMDPVQPPEHFAAANQGPPLPGKPKPVPRASARRRDVPGPPSAPSPYSGSSQPALPPRPPK